VSKSHGERRRGGRARSQREGAAEVDLYAPVRQKYGNCTAGQLHLYRVASNSRLCSNTQVEFRAKRSLAQEKSELLRQIPSVDELLRQARMAKLAARVPRELLVEVARDVLASVRAEITDEKGVSVIPIVPSDLEDVIAREVERILSHTLHPVINATGVVLHTNLGRAPLSPA